MDFVYVIVILRGMVEEVIRFSREDVGAAEQTFVQRLCHHAPGVLEYSVADMQACVEDGFEGFDCGTSSVQLHWSDS